MSVEMSNRLAWGDGEEIQRLPSFYFALSTPVDWCILAEVVSLARHGVVIPTLNAYLFETQVGTLLALGILPLLDGMHCSIVPCFCPKGAQPAGRSCAGSIAHI